MKFAKLRVIFWLLLLFASGALFGSASSRWTMADGWARPGGKPPERIWRERRVETLRRVLDLSDEQLRQMDPAFDRFEADLRSLNQETRTRSYAIIAANGSAIWPALSSEQQEKFKSWFKEVRANWPKAAHPATSTDHP